jgi:hypothetical protein
MDDFIAVLVIIGSVVLAVVFVVWLYVLYWFVTVPATVAIAAVVAWWHTDGKVRAAFYVATTRTDLAASRARRRLR